MGIFGKEGVVALAEVGADIETSYLFGEVQVLGIVMLFSCCFVNFRETFADVLALLLPRHPACAECKGGVVLLHTGEPVVETEFGISTVDPRIVEVPVSALLSAECLQAHTLEGRIVRMADRVAYINHDIDDAVRAGVISEDDIPDEIVKSLGDSKSERISTLVSAIVENSDGDIKMDNETHKYYDMLHNFLYDSVYKNPVAKSEETKVLGIVEGLFKYYLKNPEKMSPEYLKIAENEGKIRAIADYIAGMTDHYAITVYSDIYIPKAWSI